MKTRIYLLVVLCLFSNTTIFAQTEEEKSKQFLDSIMKTVPAEQRQIMEQMLQQGKEADMQRQQKKTVTREPQKQVKQKSQDDFYWRNTIASTSKGIFSDWPYGAVSLKAKYLNKAAKEIEISVGSISRNGEVSFSLPDIDPNSIFAGIQRAYTRDIKAVDVNKSYVNFSKPDVPFFSMRFWLEVYAGEKLLGSLRMGNEIHPVVNLNAPCCLQKAGDGYFLYWVYVAEDASIKGEKNVGKKGEKKITHNLNLSKGWNLIQISVEGSVTMATINGLEDQWQNISYKSVQAAPADRKYFFTKNN